jgi:RimJ/RimL family protein N-acetyltransferase
MSPIVRAAIIPDYKAIVAYDEFLGDRRIDMERGELFVADMGVAKAVGYLKLTSNEFCNKPLISIVNVREDSRHQGIATALIQDAISRTGWKKVYISTEPSNSAMLTLLPRLGFKEVGTIRELNFDGEDEIFFCFEKYG